MAKNCWCPVCGKHYFSDEIFEECPICHWTHDIVQEEEPNLEQCGNIMSLNQAKEAWEKGEKIF